MKFKVLGAVSLAGCLIAVSGAAAQDPVFDATGSQQNRDYFASEPYETIDTLAGGLILTFTDLVLPGNAGRELRFQRTYNSKGAGAWTFAVGACPVSVRNASGPIAGSSTDTMPTFTGPDGAKRKTWWTDASQIELLTDTFWRYDRVNHIAYLPDGTECTFDADGELASERDQFGNVTSVGPMPSGTGKRYSQVLGSGQTRIIDVEYEGGHPKTMIYGTKTWQYVFENGLLTSVRPPVGPAWTYGYDAAGMLAAVTTPQGGVVTYAYKWQQFFRDETDPSPHRIQVTSRVITQRSGDDRAGHIGHWSYDYESRIENDGSVTQRTTITGPTTVTTYEHASVRYDINGVQGTAHYPVTARTTSALGAATPAETEARLYVAALLPGDRRSPVLRRREITRDGVAHWTEHDYHLQDYVTYADYHQPYQTRESGNRTTTRTFRHLQSPYLKGLVTEEKVVIGVDVAENRYIRTADFNGLGFRTNGIVDGVSTTYAPDAYGNVATVTNGNGHTRSYTYEWGVPKAVSTSEPGYSITRVINSDGTIASQTQAGRTTAFEYDDLFRPTKVIPAGGTNPTITTYDNLNGRTVTITRGGQNVPNAIVTTTLDGFGRPMQTDNSVGVRTLTEYDAEGRKIKESYPFATTGTIATVRKDTETTYDALGRVRVRKNPDGTDSIRTYDLGKVTIEDENTPRRRTEQTYEAFGDPDDARLVSVKDAKNQLWSYTYNARGQIRSVTAPDGIRREWTYKTHTANGQEWTTGRLATETHPESGTVTYVSYDGAGNLTRKTDAKGTPFVYTYDANERLATVTAGSPPARVTTITYEPGSDNRATAVTDEITTRYTYDAAGRLEYRQDVVDGEVFSTQFGYDGNDHLTSIRYPKSGRTVEFARDAEGRVLTVHEGQKTYASDFVYHPSGAVASYRAGNGLTSTFDVDPNRYWPTRIQSGALDLQYGTYDGVGNVGTIADARPAYTQTFAYDELDRITGASGVYGTVTYDYDAHGNRTGGSSTTYAYDLSKLRLLRQGLRTFTYDDNGNLTSRAGGAGAATFTYTPENLVTGVTTAAGASGYTYDADQWRVKRVTGNQVSYFLRGPTGELLCEWRPGAASGSIRDYVYAGSRLLAVIER